MAAGFTPAFDGQKCSLGYQAIEWLEEFACHGPGDVEGDPLDFRTDPEVEQFIIDCYALDPVTGRRLVDRAAYSAPKGRATWASGGRILTRRSSAASRASATIARARTSTYRTVASAAVHRLVPRRRMAARRHSSFQMRCTCMCCLSSRACTRRQCATPASGARLSRGLC